MENSSASASKRGDDDMKARRIRELQDDLNEAKEDGNKRISDAPQFKQMKQIMQKQSTTIRDLRIRLQRYEPDACKEEDD
jgi:hypothetical protein